MKPKASLYYRPEIDGLRAIAVLVVVLFHAGFNVFSGGYVGVDVFFVLSGYLITHIVLDELQIGSFSFTKFYSRRARRLLPALYLMLAVCLGFGWRWLPPDSLGTLTRGVVSVLTLTANFFFFSSSRYFDPSAELNPILHTWSLGVEEQFYLLFPALLYFIHRKKKEWLGPILFSFLLLSLTLSIVTTHSEPHQAFYLLPSRAWEMLLGSLVALLPKAALKRSWMDSAMSFIGLSLILFAVFEFDSNTSFPGIHALVPCLGTALLLIFLTPKSKLGALLSSRGFVGLGRISYSLYLWHVPVFAFARVRSIDALDSSDYFLLTVLSIVIGALSYLLIEQPYRKSRVSSQLKTFQQLFPITVVILCASLFLNRFPITGMPIEIMDFVRGAQWTQSKHPCYRGTTAFDSPDRCSTYHEKSKWAVLGDSHGLHTAVYLQQKLAEANIGLSDFSAPSCNPIDLVSGGDCKQTILRNLNYIANSKSIENVVIEFRYSAYIYGYHQQHDNLTPSLSTNLNVSELSDRQKDLQASLNHIVGVLNQHGKLAFLVYPKPELQKNIQYTAWLFRDVQTLEAETRSSTAAFFKTQRLAFEVLDSISGKSLVRIFPNKKFCDSKLCKSTQGGRSLYVDHHHLSLFGVSLYLEAIVRQYTSREAG